MKRKGWLTEQEFLNGLALAQFLPGATFVTLTVFMGFRLRRLAGALASFVGFLLPPFGLMVILSYLYFRYSGVPLVDSAFTGIEAVVVALIANAVLDIGKSVIKDWKTLAVAVICLGAAWFKVNIFLILLLAATLGIVLYRPWKTTHTEPPNKIPTTHFRFREIFITLVVITVVTLLFALNPLLLQLESVFFRICLLVFGNGFTMIPLIQQEVVI